MNKIEMYEEKTKDLKNEIEKKRYLMYSYLDLICEVVYKLTSKDPLNDLDTRYSITNIKSNGENIGEICTVTSEIEKDIYLIFEIVAMYGVDKPLEIRFIQFTKSKKIPAYFKSIWDLLEDEEEG